MIRIVRAADRHQADYGWLQTRWLFSFSEYHDPSNIHCGMLRVFNDDWVRPGEGFPTHPHSEMDIVTLVLEGEITHEDSMGHRESIGAGGVQSMSAGTGITHSEFNRADVPLHLYQLWFYPKIRGLIPAYGRADFNPEDWKDRLLPVASGMGHAGAAVISTDAAVFRSSLSGGLGLDHSTGPGRRLFVYLTSGELELEGETLRTGDQARVADRESLQLKAIEPSEFVLVDTPRYGRE